MAKKTSLRIIKKSLSSKKLSTKKSNINKKDLEMAVKIQQVIKDNEEREKNKVYQQEIDKAMKEIKEKKKKSVRDDARPPPAPPPAPPPTPPRGRRRCG